MAVTMSGKLPATDRNGFDEHWSDKITEDPGKPHLVVGVISTSKVTRNVETGEDTPTVHFAHVEVCDHDHPEAANLRGVVEQLYGERTGKWPLSSEAE